MMISDVFPGNPTKPQSYELPGDPTKPQSYELPGDPTKPESYEFPGNPTKPESYEFPGDPSKPQSYEFPGDPSKPQPKPKPQDRNDYYSHVHRMARNPSVLTDVPHHTHGQALFSNPAPGRHSFGGQYSFKPREGAGDVDVEANGYIEQKHKGFELFKWRTFKTC